MPHFLIHKHLHLLLTGVLFTLLCLPSGLSLGLPVGLSQAHALDSVPDRKAILNTLKKDHPRLLATADDFAAIKKSIATDPLMKQWHDTLLIRAASFEKAKPIKMDIRVNGSRAVLQGTAQLRLRMYVLGMLYQLHGEQKYADLAWRDMQVAIDTPDWNPRHFLGVAETTRALAIGYDWLYDALTPEQRKAVEDALLDKAFKYALAAYRGQYIHGWWPAVSTNWNQVCNGGIGMGALAIADKHPEIAGEILTNVVRLLPIAMHEYAPDGAWPEGIAYWGYGGGFNVQIIASLDTALGTDFGLADMPGYGDTPWFPILLTGPSGLAFNYGDSPAVTRSRSPDMLWFAKRFNQPYFAKHYLKHARGSVLDLLWYDAKLQSAVKQSAAPIDTSKLPNDHRFGKVDVFTFTNDLDDPNATWLAFKAGDNAFNHSHLDLGSFVLDALGQRFVVDLGSDSYELPTYFHAKRWTYFRTRAESHNVVQINPSALPGQSPRARARVLSFDVKDDGTGASASIDLTAAYAYQLPAPKKVIRTFTREHQNVTVEDVIEPAGDAEAAAATAIRWHLYTPAAVELTDDGATLTLKGKMMKVRIVSPAGSQFEVSPASPLSTSPNPAGQNPNKGIVRLSLLVKTETQLGEKAKAVSIRVELMPVEAETQR